MIIPKACPRCIGGDIITRAEDTRTVATCLQCGYRREFVAAHGIVPPRAFIRDMLAQERRSARHIDVLS